MEAKKWISLKKTSLGYTLDTSVDEMISTNHSCRNVKYPLTHVAFDCSGERLVTADSNGLLILVELGQSMRYCRLGKVQSCTVVAFNPADSMEILVGANNGNIQIVKLNGKAKDYCSLIGHKFAVRHVSHYKSYTLTSSLKEVIIWDLSISSKIHRLRLAAATIGVRKGGFSSQGSVAVLYRDSTLQLWKLKKLKEDIKIDAKVLGLQDAKDYEFTRDGRTIILSGISNIILILNTLTWDLVKRLVLPDSLANIKELSVLPQPLDGGANKIAAILSSNYRLYFLDLDTSCLVPLSCGTFLTRVRQMKISPSGVHVAYIDILGCLRLELADTLLVLKPQSKVKVKMTSQPRVHDVNDHLSCVRQDIKQELNLERLMLILNKFGKYPGKHRTLIWATILELPRNRPTYAALSNKIASHELTGRILSDYPLENRSKAMFLATIFNCLVHWCPMLTQCTFLPRLIFPFLIVMQGNHIFAFEIIIFILLNYCQQWFEYHPLPPLSVLAMLENILSEHDPQLLDFFCKKRVTTTEYVWPLLESMMSEVLCGDEWLILWDHLFTLAHPPLLLMCSLAYSICSRQIIMSRLQSIEDFRCFYHAQGHVQVEDLLKVAHRLDQNTPHHLHPTKYFGSEKSPLPRTGPYPVFLHDQYPKFLTEDSRIKLQELYQQENPATILRRQEHAKLRSLAEKKLNMEKEKFLKEIDANRIHESRRCYEENIWKNKLRIENNYKRDESSNSPCHHNEKELDLGIDNEFMDRRKQPTNCQTLRDKVQKLESDVQMLLDSMDSQ